MIEELHQNYNCKLLVSVWHLYSNVQIARESHPGDRSGENEIWSYGEKNQKILTDFIKLRYRFWPYIYARAHKVSDEGYTVMRALVFYE